MSLRRTLFVGLVAAAGAFAATLDQYHFSNNLVDSGTLGSNGSTLSGSPSFSASVPSTPFANTSSLSLGAGDGVVFSQAFPFDTAGDATLQFYVNPGSFGTGDLFWTTNTGGDLNRYNIFLESITGGYQLNVDYREPGGNLHNLLNPSQGGVAVNHVIPVGLWTFIAVVRSGNAYSVYFNSDTSPTASATDSSPSLPTSGGWTINGRTLQSGCCQFNGLMDELAISDAALSPSQFENAAAAAPEPATFVLIVVALGSLALRRWASSRSCTSPR